MCHERLNSTLRVQAIHPPQALAGLGRQSNFLEQNFESCKLAGHINNRYGVMNAETTYHPEIFVGPDLIKPWPEFRRQLMSFG